MKKFEIHGVIGMGAYGVVLKATNRQTKEIGIVFSRMTEDRI